MSLAVLGDVRTVQKISFVIDHVQIICSFYEGVNFVDAGDIGASYEEPAKHFYNASFKIIHAYNGMPALLAGYIEGDGCKECIGANKYFRNHSVLFVVFTIVVDWFARGYCLQEPV